MKAGSPRAKRYCSDLLQKLVDTPSVFPSEEEILLLLEREFLMLGLHPRRIDVEDGRFNLLCRIGEGRPHLCLNAHVDTVPANGRSLPSSRVDGDILYGLGSCDDKASVAAMSTAMLEVASRRSEVSGTIDLLLSVDEEGDAKGIKAAVAQGYRCDMAIVGEPTCLDIVHAHCGLLFLALETRGVSAHGCCPENGVSAVDRMLVLVDELRELPRKYPAHPEIGGFSLNLGELHAGDRPNRVPNSCTARVDIRLVPPARVGRVLELAAEIVGRHEWASCRVEKMGEALDTPVDSRLVNAAREVTRDLETGGRPIGWRGWTEAESFQTLLGIDAIVIGPGDIRQAHSADEFVSNSETQRAAEIYAALAMRICGGKS